MKKIVSVLATLALVGTLAFAQEAEATEESKSSGILNGTASFTNKLQINTFTATKDGVQFGGMWNQMEASYESDMLDIYAQARIKLNVSDEGVPNGIGYSGDDTYLDLNFKPGYGFEIGVHHDISIPGAYCYVEDDSMNLGQLGRDGFDFAWVAQDDLEGLVLVANCDFLQIDGTNYFVDPVVYVVSGAKKYAFTTGFGGYYEYAKDDSDIEWSVGGQFLYGRDNTYNDYSAGAFVSFKTFDAWTIWTGYTYNANGDLEDAEGSHVMNFSTSYESGNFFCGADYVTDFAKYLYTGVSVGYEFEDAGVTADVYAQGVAAYDDFANGTFWVVPDVTVKIGDFGKIRCGVEVDFDGGEWDSVSVPVRWTYKL